MKISEHSAAVALSEEDAQHPYVSIFFTSTEGRIDFTALLVAGTEAVEEESRLIYRNSAGKFTTTDPDAIGAPLIAGTLYRGGAMELNDNYPVMLHTEQDAVTFIAVMRAVYQMQGEIAGAKA